MFEKMKQNNLSLRRSIKKISLIVFTILFLLFELNKFVYADYDPLLLSSNFTPSINAEYVLVSNTEFDKTLFAQQASSAIPLPAANRLMLSLLVVENLNLQQEIKLSEAALAEGAADDFPQSINFNAEQSYTVSNLLIAMLYEHSRIATHALAETVGITEANAVTLMNRRAEELEMTQTNFSNCIGDLSEAKDQSDNQSNDMPALTQKSSLNDMYKLITKLMANPTLNHIFSEKEYFSKFPNGSIVAQHHPYEQIFLLSEKGITAAWDFYFEDMSFSFVSGTINNNQYLMMMSDHQHSKFLKEYEQMIEQMDQYYVVTPLVSQNQSYPGIDKTVEGDEISLVFLNTIQYVHPKDNDFLNPAVEYISHGPHSRPLLRGTVVGTVIFTLSDGSQIEAEVESDKAILTGNTYLSKMINGIHQNPNIGILLLFLCFILICILIYHISKTIKALIKHRRLAELNEFQKNLQDKINKQ